MQSVALSIEGDVDPEKFVPWLQDLCAEGRRLDLAREGHYSPSRMSQSGLSFKGVHMLLDGDLQREWKPRGKAREPARLHRPQPQGRRDYPGIPELRGVKLEAMPRRATGKSRRSWPLPPSPRMSCRSMPGLPLRRRVSLGKSRRLRSKTAPCFSPRPAPDSASPRILTPPFLRPPRRRVNFITGGDDGRVVAVSPDGATQEIANEKGKWIDALAARDDGAIAWSSGKNVRARDHDGVIKTFAAPSTVRGLAFMPKGYRIAIAHYDGASLWFPNTAAPP